MNKDRSFSKKLDKFFDGKGFYIVLTLCVALLGVSGYFLLTGNDGTDVENSSLNEGYTDVNDDPEQALTIPIDEGDGEPVEPVNAPVESEEGDEAQVWNEQQAQTAVSAAMIWPVAGEIDIPFTTQALVYNDRLGDWRTSTCVELRAAVGEQVLACSAGIITELYNDDINGTTVVIEHAGGLTSVYSNMAALPPVKVGDNVMTGEVIGSVGLTALGQSKDNCHLCLTMLLDGECIDPAKYLPAR